MSDLVAIRTALLAPFAAAATGLGAPVVTYQAAPQGKPWPVGSPVVRAVVGLPARSAIGGQVDRIVQQDGTLALQWLFPRGTGMAAITAAIEGTVAIYRAQTLDGGVILVGDARSTRIGNEADRVRWDVVIPWRTVEREAAAGNAVALRGSLPTTASALAAVRNLWLTRIEQAGTGWAGLRTVYDSEPVWATPPALPFAGYWLDTVASASQETQAGTEQVVGRALVQLHTDPNLGAAAPLAIVDRICAEHVRTQSGVTFRLVQTVAQSASRAGTLQTNLRIPFAFERLRLS